MPDVWECDGRVFESREEAERYAGMLADPPPIRREGGGTERRSREGLGCGMLALLFLGGGIVVLALLTVELPEMSGGAALVLALVIGWQINSMINDLRSRNRSLEREVSDLEQQVRELESQLYDD